MARKEKNTKTHNIFLLDKSRLLEQFSTEENATTPTLLEALMQLDDKYVAQTLKDDIGTLGYSIKLYFRKMSFLTISKKSKNVSIVSI